MIRACGGLGSKRAQAGIDLLFGPAAATGRSDRRSRCAACVQSCPPGHSWASSPAKVAPGNPTSSSSLLTTRCATWAVALMQQAAAPSLPLHFAAAGVPACRVAVWCDVPGRPSAMASAPGMAFSGVGRCWHPPPPSARQQQAQVHQHAQDGCLVPEGPGGGRMCWTSAPLPPFAHKHSAPALAAPIASRHACHAAHQGARWPARCFVGHTHSLLSDFCSMLRSTRCCPQLDNFYLTPMCSQTRAQLLTGREFPKTGTLLINGGLNGLSRQCCQRLMAPPAPPDGCGQLKPLAPVPPCRHTTPHTC